jgi:hypothetical protein
LRHYSPGEVFLGFDDVEFNEFSWQAAHHEHHPAIGHTGQTVSTGNEPFNSCRFHSR